ncbi:spore germination protein KC [Kroppenstedtia sanguinis]|uniref:Ger(x)C family spore germination protein n=1 Tax=Kroppenstedtia sanguinis TaxID=1380684 RepID=UPI003D1E5065
MYPPLRNLLFCLLSVSLLGGCWDAREIEERTSVIALGFDKHPAGYEISVQVPIPLKIVGSGGGGGGESGQNAVHVFKGTGKTVSDTLDDIQNQTNQRLFYGQTRLLIIGEEVAKEGIGRVVDGLKRHPEVRRHQWPLVVKGKAKDAMKANPKLEQIPMEYIVTLVENGVRIGKYNDEDFGKTLINLSSPAKHPVMNFIEISPQLIEWKGLAVFNKGKMAGRLSREESEPMLRLRNKEKGETVNVPCGGKKSDLKVVFRAKEMSRKIQVKQREGRLPEIHVHIKMKGDIIEKTCAKYDLSQPGIYKKMNRWVADRYELTTRKTIRKMQKELKVDAFHFGNMIRAHHPDLWKKLDWNRDFPNVPIRATYEVQIRRTGLEFK